MRAFCPQLTQNLYQIELFSFSTFLEHSPPIPITKSPSAQKKLHLHSQHQKPSSESFCFLEKNRNPSGCGLSFSRTNFVLRFVVDTVKKQSLKEEKMRKEFLRLRKKATSDSGERRRETPFFVNQPKHTFFVLFFSFYPSAFVFYYLDPSHSVFSRKGPSRFNYYTILNTHLSTTRAVGSISANTQCEHNGKHPFFLLFCSMLLTQ